MKLWRLTSIRRGDYPGTWSDRRGRVGSPTVRGKRGIADRGLLLPRSAPEMIPPSRSRHAILSIHPRGHDGQPCSAIQRNGPAQERYDEKQPRFPPAPPPPDPEHPYPRSSSASQSGRSLGFHGGSKGLDDPTRGIGRTLVEVPTSRTFRSAWRRCVGLSTLQVYRPGISFAS